MLTPEQIENFNGDGYLVVPDVVTDQLPAVRDEYAQLLHGLCTQWGIEFTTFEDARSRLAATPQIDIHR